MDSRQVDRTPRPDAAIFDMDGTLCDVRSIRHLVEAPDGAKRFRANFHQFHAQSITCPPYPDVARLLARLRAEGYAILIVTAREALWADLTSEWLALHSIEHDEVFTRPLKDYRPDAVIKEEIAAAVKERYSPKIAIDDRAAIIEVWHRAGIPTCWVSDDGSIGAIERPSGSDLAPDLERVVSGKDYQPDGW